MDRIGVHSSRGNPEIILEGDLIRSVGSKRRPGIVDSAGASEGAAEKVDCHGLVSKCGVLLFGNVGSGWANMRLSESERPPSGQDVGLVGECIALKSSLHETIDDERDAIEEYIFRYGLIDLLFR